MNAKRCKRLRKKAREASNNQLPMTAYEYNARRRRIELAGCEKQIYKWLKQQENRNGKTPRDLPR